MGEAAQPRLSQLDKEEGGCYSPAVFEGIVFAFMDGWFNKKEEL
jgi:hypothetical protein